jgi:hypothetical protein
MIIAETFAARLLERELRAPQRRPTTELLVVCKSWKVSAFNTIFAADSDISVGTGRTNSVS